VAQWLKLFVTALHNQYPTLSQRNDGVKKAISKAGGGASSGYFSAPGETYG